jgi:hypothetical protein
MGSLMQRSTQNVQEHCTKEHRQTRHHYHHVTSWVHFQSTLLLAWQLRRTYCLQNGQRAACHARKLGPLNTTGYQSSCHMDIKNSQFQPFLITFRHHNT